MKNQKCLSHWFGFFLAELQEAEGNGRGNLMEKEKHKPGLLLQMKKRRMFVEAEDDTENFDYLLFGNFDGLSILEAEKWYDFAPSINPANLDDAIRLLTKRILRHSGGLVPGPQGWRAGDRRR